MAPMVSPAPAACVLVPVSETPPLTLAINPISPASPPIEPPTAAVATPPSVTRLPELEIETAVNVRAPPSPARSSPKPPFA